MAFLGGDKPICYLTKGAIAGVISEILNVDVIVDDKLCQTRGDPYCLIKN